MSFHKGPPIFHIWEGLQGLCDPVLKELASILPKTILACRADTTARKYISTFRHWKEWGADFGMEAIPAKEFELALYLQHLASASRSRVAVEEACNALTWVHSTVGLAMVHWYLKGFYYLYS